MMLTILVKLIRKLQLAAMFGFPKHLVGRADSVIPTIIQTGSLSPAKALSVLLCACIEKK